jgi:hypothetical protein
LITHKANSKSHLKKVDSSGAKKIYEDSNILIVKPLTLKHLVNMVQEPDGVQPWQIHQLILNQYTSSHDQALYYVILEKI